VTRARMGALCAALLGDIMKYKIMSVRRRRWCFNNDYNNVLPILNANRIFRNHAVHHYVYIGIPMLLLQHYDDINIIYLPVGGGYFFFFNNNICIYAYIIERLIGPAVVVEVVFGMGQVSGLWSVEVPI